MFKLSLLFLISSSQKQVIFSSLVSLKTPLWRLISSDWQAFRKPFIVRGASTSCWCWSLRANWKPARWYYSALATSQTHQCILEPEYGKREQMQQKKCIRMFLVSSGGWDLKHFKTHLLIARLWSFHCFSISMALGGMYTFTTNTENRLCVHTAWNWWYGGIKANILTWKIEKKTENEAQACRFLIFFYQRNNFSWAFELKHV